jgi:hypothetical protein
MALPTPVSEVRESLSLLYTATYERRTMTHHIPLGLQALVYNCQVEQVALQRFGNVTTTMTRRQEQAQFDT